MTFSREDATGTALVPAGGLVRTGYDSQGRQYHYRVVREVVAGDGQASIKVPVEATETGAAFNVGVGTIVEFSTSFPGWDAVTNESGWITREGRDDEEDGRTLAEGESVTATTGLRRRIGLAWTSGNRCNDDAYMLAALNAGAWDVVIKHHRGVHTVDVFVTGPTGLASAELIAAVEEKISDPEYGLPSTDDWHVYTLVGVDMNWDLTLYMLPGQAEDEAGIQAAALAVLNALHNPSAPVAGVSPFKAGQDVILQQAFAALKAGGVSNLKRVEFTSPPDDETIAPNQLAVLGSTPVITVIEASEE